MTENEIADKPKKWSVLKPPLSEIEMEEEDGEEEEPAMEEVSLSSVKPLSSGFVSKCYVSLREGSSSDDEGEGPRCREEKDLRTRRIEALLGAVSETDPRKRKADVQALLCFDEIVESSRDVFSRLETFTVNGSLKAAVLATPAKSSKDLFFEGVYLEIEFRLHPSPELSFSLEGFEMKDRNVEGAECTLGDDRLLVRFPLWKGKETTVVSSVRGKQERIDVLRSFPADGTSQKTVFGYRVDVRGSKDRARLDALDGAVKSVTGLDAHAYTIKSIDKRAYDEKGKEVPVSQGINWGLYPRSDSMEVVFGASGCWRADPKIYSRYPKLSVSLDWASVWNHARLEVFESNKKVSEKRVDRYEGRLRVSGVALRAHRPQPVQRSLSPRSITSPYVQGNVAPKADGKTGVIPTAEVKWDVSRFNSEKDVKKDTTEVTVSFSDPMARASARESFLQPHSARIVVCDPSSGELLCTYSQREAPGISVRCRYSVGLGRNRFSVVTQNNDSPRGGNDP